MPTDRSRTKAPKDAPDDSPDDAPDRGRVAKVLARAGVASRREVERLIAAGRVRLNGRVLDTPAVVLEGGETLEVDGKPVPTIGETRLWRYHKPPGLVTSHRDEAGRPTVFDSLPPELPRVVSVGRLDLTSEGLLLLTNDGTLAGRLEAPATGWLRRYRVRLHGRPTEAELARLAEGLTIDGVRYGPVTAQLERQQGGNAWLMVGLREGKNREVRKLMAHFGWDVGRLIRVSYGPFQLGRLAPGAVEEVSGKVLREQLSGLIPAASLPQPAQKRRRARP